MTTAKRIKTDEMVKYRNKFNGIIYFGPRKPVANWIDGVKYLQVVDALATRGCLVRSEYLEKVTTNGHNPIS